jgi:hypothetical protein
VQGSKAGVISTQFLHSGDNTLQKAFLIMCGNDDNLMFRLCKNETEYELKHYMGGAQLHIPSLILRNKYELNLDDDFIRK